MLYVDTSQLGKHLGEGAQATIHVLEPSPDPRSKPFPRGAYCAKVMATADVRNALNLKGPACDPACLRECHDALRALSALQHPNVICYEQVAFVEDRLLVIVMRRYACTLGEWLFRHRTQLSDDTVLHIALQLGEALQYLHERYVWHLDANLTNVLVDDERSARPTCVLIDLETSTAGGRAPSSNFTAEMAAPERATQPSDKCDVFSLGVLLFALAARHEYPGLVDDVPDLGCVSMNHAQLTPTRVAAVVRRDLPRASDGLVSLVAMMLNHDPKTRTSMASVVANLRALRDGGSSLTFPFVLGPFALVPVGGPDAASVDLYIKSGMYDLHTTCYKCLRNRSKSKTIRSDCTSTGIPHLPAHTSAPWTGAELLPELQLPQSAEGDAGARSPSTPPSVPVDAHPTMFMVFLYPFSSEPSVRKSLEPGGVLQSHGGFAVYADPSANLSLSGSVDASIVTPSHVFAITGAQASGPGAERFPRLHFSAAQPWPSALTEQLRSAGRVHEDVPALLGSSAKCFCWLLPHEAFTLPNGEKWVAAPEGGFVFWFNPSAHEPHELDRYFAVSPPVRSAIRGGGGGGGGALALATSAAAISDVFTRGANSLGDACRTLGRAFSRGGGDASGAAGAAADGPRIFARRLSPTFIRISRGYPDTRSFFYEVPADGSRGSCDELICLDARQRSALRLPPEATWLAYLRPDEREQGPPRPGAATLSVRTLALGGFVALDRGRKLVAVLALLPPFARLGMEETFELRLGAPTIATGYPHATMAIGPIEVAAPQSPGSPLDADWDIVAASTEGDAPIRWIGFARHEFSFYFADARCGIWQRRAIE